MTKAGIVGLLLCSFVPDVCGADWPTYRADAARSGYTAGPLPERLSLSWRYTPRHAPRPAWSGRDTRTPFDRAYHTAIAGRTLFFGSSADGKVYALDAATGAERWSFFTGGPVRFAPALWRDRVFVVSDDGFLYCLAAKDGSLLWKRRGGPIDSMVLGNGRMISRWPARGGPVIADGIVYFAAGIWPSEGIFVHAVDAATGKLVWCNDTAGSIYMPQPHGGANARSGVSAHGNLVVAGDKLLVPTGRGVPAAFDRADGKFLYFHLQRYGHQGGSAIVAAGSHFFNSNGIFDAASGHLAYKGVATSTVAVTPKHIIHAARDRKTARDEILAVDRDKTWVERETVDRKGRKTTRTVFGAPVWRMGSPHGTTRSLIVAGDVIIAGGAKSVSVLDMASKKTRMAAEVDGVPYGLAVADGRLFVSTDKGTIYCFDGEAAAGAKAIKAKVDPSRYGDNAVFAAAAEEIIQRTALKEGYCLDLGCGNGGLAFELARRTELQIYAADPDPANVAAARRKLDAAGLYGIRVTVHQADPANTPYPNYFANLVVSARSVINGAGAAPAKEMQRLVRPYGGIACIGKPGAMKKTVRGGLDGVGSWTHQYCDPTNTNCSTDTLVRGPLGMLWFTDFGFQMPSRHGRGPAPLFLDGRLFIEGADALRCVDAYNGRTLWERPLPAILKAYDQEHLMGTAGTGSNLCMTRDGVYVHTRDKCLKLDPATGTLLAEIQAPRQPDGNAGTWGYIACTGEMLFGTLSDTRHTVKWRFGRSDMRTQFTESLLLFAMDAKTGKLKWSYRPEHSIRNNAIAIGRGRVYLIDRPTALRDMLDQEAAKRRSRPLAEHPLGTLAALNAADGKVAWKASENIYGTMLALSEKHNVLLMCYQNTRFKLASERGGRMAAFRASDGKRLWDIQARYASRPILNGRTIYAQPGAWDLLTGEPKDFELKRSYGCGILAGSTNLMVFRSATLGYIDLLHNHGTEDYGGIRPGCWINALPVGGLLLMPDATDRCTCSYLIKASIALQPYGIRPPAIAPDGGAFRKPLMAKLAVEADHVDIRYTLDGSVPTRSSRQYTGPIEVSRSGTLKARAFRPKTPPSQVASAEFIIDPNIVPLKGAAWRVYDSPGARPPKSKWQVVNGVLTELSNLYVGSAGNADPTTERPGTLRIYTPGAAFTDGELTLDIASSDDDGLGVALRFGGPDRHYVWAMDRQRRFHVLACKNADVYRVLARNPKGYQRNRWYRLRVVLQGPRIAVYLDGEKDLEATDETFPRGTFALYAWGCAGAKFRNVKWK